MESFEYSLEAEPYHKFNILNTWVDTCHFTQIAGHIGMDCRHPCALDAHEALSSLTSGFQHSLPERRLG